MVMRKPVPAICSGNCLSKVTNKPVLCCTACGYCSESSINFHRNCSTSSEASGCSDATEGTDEAS